MQEALQKLKEEEERLRSEEEEKLKKEEEAEKARLEALKLEQERKERKKQKEKEGKERLKAEGKLLTPKQKADRARAQAMIDSLKAQGVELPDVDTKKPRPGTRIKPYKQKNQSRDKKSIDEELPKVDEPVAIEVEIVETPVEVVEVPQPQPEPEEDVKDAWDASSGEEEDFEEVPSTGTEKVDAISKETVVKSEESEEGSSSEESDSENCKSMSKDN